MPVPFNFVLGGPNICCTPCISASQVNVSLERDDAAADMALLVVIADLLDTNCVIPLEMAPRSNEPRAAMPLSSSVWLSFRAAFAVFDAA